MSPDREFAFSQLGTAVRNTDGTMRPADEIFIEATGRLPYIADRDLRYAAARDICGIPREGGLELRQIRAFNQLEMNVVNGRFGTFDETVTEVARRLKTVEDDQLRSALAMNLMNEVPHSPPDWDGGTPVTDIDVRRGLVSLEERRRRVMEEQGQLIPPEKVKADIHSFGVSMKAAIISLSAGLGRRTTRKRGGWLYEQNAVTKQRRATFVGGRKGKLDDKWLRSGAVLDADWARKKAMES